MKTRMTKWFITLVLLVMPAIMLSAQEVKTAVPSDIQKLSVFFGNWKADLTYSSDQGQSHLVGYIKFHPVAGGFGVYAEESSSDPKMGDMKGVDIFGYDPFGKNLHCFTVDNAGTAHDHLCTWKSDKNLYMEHNSVRDGKKYLEKISCEVQGSDAMGFKMEVYLDGKRTESMSGVYHRIGD